MLRAGNNLVIVSSLLRTCDQYRLANKCGYFQSAEQRPCSTLNTSTAYQTLPIVEDALLEDNGAFLSYILVITFGE